VRGIARWTFGFASVQVRQDAIFEQWRLSEKIVLCCGEIMNFWCPLFSFFPLFSKVNHSA
jgi:hypothetical protein